jgi:hypothetical protein
MQQQSCKLATGIEQQSDKLPRTSTHSNTVTKQQTATKSEYHYAYRIQQQSNKL